VCVCVWQSVESDIDGHTALLVSLSSVCATMLSDADMPCRVTDDVSNVRTSLDDLKRQSHQLRDKAAQRRQL